MKKTDFYFKLTDLTEKITDGSHNPPKGIGHSSFLMLSSRNIFNDEINMEKVRYLTEEDFEIENRRTDLKDLDVLLTIVGTIGRSAVFDKELGNIVLQRSVAVLRPIQSKINSRFLMYNLQSKLSTLLSESRGVAQQGFYLDQLRNLVIYAPPLVVQLEIVEKLDKAFAEIDSLEKNLQLKEEKTNQLLQSMLSAAFTNTEKFNMKITDSTLGELCEVDWGNTNLTKSSYVPDGKFLAVSASGPDGRIDHYEHEGNIPVLSAIGAQCGKMFFPTEKFTAIKNTITLTPLKNVIDGKYLYYLFTHIELPQRGAGQPFISKGDIQSFKIAVPKDVKDQRVIVEMLDDAFTEIDNLRNQVSIEKERVSSLRQSILSNAFKFEEKAS